MESREAKHSANVRHPTWNPRLELDGTTVPWSSSIREFQRGHAHYVAEALKRPLLLPKDMDDFKHMRQPKLFLSLKRDLALVSSFGTLYQEWFPFFTLFLTYSFVVYVQAIQEVFVAE